MVSRSAFLVALAALLVANQPSRAAYLSDDGDYNAQTIGSALAAPWNDYGGGGAFTVLASSQSPFTNAFAANGKGVNRPAAESSGANYFVNEFSPDIPANATGFLYLNVDFRNNDENTGGYSLAFAGNAGGAGQASTLAISGNSFYAKSSGGLGDSILDPVAGNWYNVQLTFDLNTDTYSGSITPFGGASVAISPRSFIQDGLLNGIFSDDQSSGIGGTVPDHDIDNFVISTQPVPEPSTISAMTCGLIGFAGVLRRRKR